MSIIYWNICLLSQFSLPVAGHSFKNQSPSPCAELPEVGIHSLNSESIYLFSASYQLFIFPLKWKSTLWAEKDHWCLRTILPEYFTVHCKRFLLFKLVICQTATWATMSVTKQMIMFSQSYREHTQHSDCHTAIPWLQVLYGFSCCSCGYRPLWGKQALESQFTAYHIRVYSSVEIPPLNPRT